MVNSVAIRLSTTGADQVKTDLTSIGDTGDAQAKRWAKAYDSAGDQVQTAMARQAQAAAKLAAITPQTPMQMQISDANGTGFGQYEGSARQSAAAIKQQLDEQDALAARAAALKAKIDPLTVAQQKYDAEVKNSAELLAASAISESEHTAAVALSNKALSDAKHALEEHSGALGFNRQQFIIGQSAVMRFTDSILAGQSPLSAFALEAHKVGEVVATDDGGVAGGLAKVKALLTPVNIGIAAGTAALIVGAAAWYSYTSAVDKLNGLALGAGRVLGESGEQLEANAQAAAGAGDISVKAARDIETSYLQIAKSGDVLVGLTAITQDFAAATGQDAKAAAGQLGAAFTDPIRGAEDLAEKYGMLTQAQTDHIERLVEEGQQEQAQKALLADISGAVQGAADQVTGLAAAWRMVKTDTSDAFTWMGKFANTYGPDVIFGLTGIDLSRVGNGPPANQNGAAANAARAHAQAIANQYTGAGEKDQLSSTVGTLKAGIAAGGTPDQMKVWTDALNANEHALSTWMPAQEKATRLAQLDADAAKAKTPAAKAAVAAQREQLEMAGKVVTSADAQARATAASDAAAAHATHTNGAHAASLARQAESMAVAANASLALADAYLKSSAAGIEADAQRQAATDATRKGIDIQAQAERQLNLDVAQAVATAAKSVDQLREETAARAVANDNVAAGKIAVAQMNDALSNEAALRPLLTLRTIAHGDALVELNKVIDAYTEALRAAHAEEARSGAETATAGAQRQAADLRASIAEVGKSPQQQSLAAARRAAGHQADDAQYTGADRTGFINSQVDVAQAQNESSAARAADQQRRSMTDAIGLQQVQIAMVGKSADAQEQATQRIQLQQSLAKSLGDYYAQYAPELLRANDAIEANDQKLRTLKSSWQEVDQVGDQFLSDVLDPQGWSNWGDEAKRILGDVEQEMVKLALLNPLKNMLLGENNPTLSSVFSLFSGGGAAQFSSTIASNDTFIDNAIAGLPHNAAGTENWSGGMTWVNENGPEIADLPGGTRIYPASTARQMMSAANDQAPPQVIVHVQANPYFDAHVAGVSDGRIAAASPSLVAGGAKMSSVQAAKAQRRRLGS